MKTTSRIAAVACGVVSTVTLLAVPGSAGKFSGNMVTINKTVVGPAPTGTVFTVELDCFNDNAITPQGIEPIEITFDAHGTPTSQHEFEVPPTITCSAEETVTGGAQTVTYACAATGTRATCPDGATEPTLSFNDVTGSSGVITVTNTFPTPMSDPEPAPEVVVAPAFTG